jgi:hypothetical protein
MSLSNALSFLRRSFRRSHARGRRGKPRSRFMPEFMLLEDRCLMSFTPMLPTQGTVQAQGLNAVVYTPEGDPGFDQANLPEAKLVTVMNNSSNVVFPIFQGTNTTADETAGTVTRAVIEGTGGAGYFGQYKVTFSLGTGPNPTAAIAIASGNGNLFDIKLQTGGSGYQPNDPVTVATVTPLGTAPNPTTPAVIKAHVSDITQNGVVSLYDPKDPLTNTYRGYIGEKVNGQYQLGLQPGHQVTVQVPIAFWDGGRIYMVDNGPAEQAIRPLCVGRRNWLHLGGDGGLQPTAGLLSITASVRRHGFDPWVYLKHVLTELPARPAGDDLADLLPDRWVRRPGGPGATRG